MPDTKTCAICAHTKPAEDFQARNASADGLAYNCRTCQNIRSKARAKAVKLLIDAHPEQFKTLLTEQTALLGSGN